MRKGRRLLRRIAAWGISAAMSVTMLATGAVETKVEAAGGYELLGDVQGANILHCWNWSYSTIEAHMQLIAECGYTAIQTSPASQPKDYHCSYLDDDGNTVYISGDKEGGYEVGIPGKGGSGNWWKVYQPVTYNVCDNGETWFGTKAELASMCATAEKYGIKVIVDIVANHMGNIKGWQNSLADVSPQVGEYWNPEMMTDESYWHINKLQVWMSDGREDFTQGTMGMPDLNTADKRVQKYIYDFLDELIDCGVDGFRFDAAKHIETPEDDPSFASDFWPTVLGEAESHYKAKTGGNLFVYGEILNTVGDNFDIANYTKRMSVTDNSAGHHLLESMRNGQASTMSMLYPSNKAVVWAESHDTYMNESSRYASDRSIVRTWVIAGSKSEAASLFFVRPYESKDILEDDRDGSFKGNLEKTLVQAKMGECPTYLWATKEVAAVNHFNNRFSSSPDNMGTDGNIAFNQRGNGIALANLDGPGSISMGAHGLPDGSYTDEVSGGTFTVSGGTLSGNITSEYGVAVIYPNPMANPATSYPIVADKPTFQASTPTGTIVGEKEITFSVKNADSASYSVDGGAAQAFTGEVTLTVGKGIAEGEKTVVKITAEKGGKSSETTYTYTMGENKPVVTITPSDGTSFKDSLEVSIQADNTVSASYQVGDAAAVAFQGSASVVVGEEAQPGDSVTVTVNAESSNGKKVTESATFTKKEDKGHVVYAKNSAGWSTVTAYAWSTNGNIGAWPGKEMELIDAGNKIYAIDFGDADYDNIIFSEKGENKTGDLTLPGYGQIYDNSTSGWSDYVVKKPVITASPASGTITGPTEVTITIKDADSATYQINGGAEQSITGSSAVVTVGGQLGNGEKDQIVVQAKGGETVKKTFTYTMQKEDNTGNQGDNTGNQGDNTGNQGDNTGNQGDNTGNQGDNTGNQGDNTGNQGDNTGNQGDNTGNQGDNTGNQGDNTGNQGDNTGNQGDNTGNQGDNTGNQSGNTGSQGDNSGSQSGNTGSQDLPSLASQVTVVGYKGIYDGGQHSLNVIAPSDVTMMYSTSANDAYSAAAPVFKNAGTYQVYYKAGKSGYQTLAGSAVVEIQPKEVTVPSGIMADIKGYDGTTIASIDCSNAVINGLVAGDRVSVTARGTFMDAEAGENKAVILSGLALAGEEAGNYRLAASGNQAQAVSSIVTQVMNSEVTASGDEVMYDGQPHTIRVTLPSDATIRYGTIEGNYGLSAAPSFTEPGSYRVYYKVSKSGFGDVVGFADVVINGLTVQTAAGTSACVAWQDAISQLGAGAGQIVVYGTVPVTADCMLHADTAVIVLTSGTLKIEKGVCLTGGQISGRVINDGVLRNVVLKDPQLVSGSGTIDNGNSGQQSGGSGNTSGGQQPGGAGDTSGGQQPGGQNEQAGGAISDQLITLSAAELEYNGKVQRPSVMIQGLQEGTDYDVEYADGCRDVGSYRITITGKGAYTGKAFERFDIVVVKNHSYTVGNFVYKVTSVENDTVSVTGTKKKSAASLKVANQVKIGGQEFEVTEIGASAFAGMKNLKTVTVGTKVKKIGKKAFYGDSKLKKLTVKSKNLKSVGSLAVKGIYKKAVIRVPSAKLKAYKALFKSDTGYQKSMKIRK